MRRLYDLIRRLLPPCPSCGPLSAENTALTRDLMNEVNNSLKLHNRILGLESEIRDLTLTSPHSNCTSKIQAQDRHIQKLAGQLSEAKSAYQALLAKTSQP